jgi:hypothetical protein
MAAGVIAAASVITLRPAQAIDTGAAVGIGRRVLESDSRLRDWGLPNSPPRSSAPEAEQPTPVGEIQKFLTMGCD